MSQKYGKLYVVATPIGNLSDITFRALEILKTVDLIAAEDTRRTKELLNHFDISTPLISCYEYNEFDKSERILDDIKKNKNIAIVSDAGTPLVSDPGNILVKKAIEEDIEVIAIPGACAAINALVMSGISTKSFVFVGFLPDDKKKKKQLMESLINETKTMIFYISPHNLKKEIKYLIEVFGNNRVASLAREMTKKYEENIRGNLGKICRHFDDNEVRGEFVLVISGKDELDIEKNKKEKWLSMNIKEHIEYYKKQGIDEKDAMKKVAKDREINKREVYKILKVKE